MFEFRGRKRRINCKSVLHDFVSYPFHNCIWFFFLNKNELMYAFWISSLIRQPGIALEATFACYFTGVRNSETITPALMCKTDSWAFNPRASSLSCTSHACGGCEEASYRASRETAKSMPGCQESEGQPAMVVPYRWCLGSSGVLQTARLLSWWGEGCWWQWWRLQQPQRCNAFLVQGELNRQPGMCLSTSGASWTSSSHAAVLSGSLRHWKTVSLSHKGRILIL